MAQVKRNFIHLFASTFEAFHCEPRRLDMWKPWTSTTANNEFKQTYAGNLSGLIWPSFSEQTLCCFILWAAIDEAVSWQKWNEDASCPNHEWTRQVSDVIFPVFNRNNLLFSAFGTSFQAITRFPFPFHQISSETEVRFHRDVRPSAVFAKFCSKSRHQEAH